MVVIRFGKWISKATNLFVYERVITNKGKLTPLCVKKFRHVGRYPGSVEQNQPVDCGWTPISQPPKKNGRYLVSVKSFLADDENMVGIASYAKDLSKVDPWDFKTDSKAGFYSYSNEFGYAVVEDVVAWMPVPKAYKGGE